MLWNAVKAKEQRRLELKEEVRKLQGKIVVPADQPIKQTIPNKTYAEITDGSTIPTKSTVKPPAKPSAKPFAKPSALDVENTKLEKTEMKQVEEP